MNNPLVTVIVPVYNCENYISNAIDSILSQNYTNLEVLIGDDASTDGSWKIIESYSRDPRVKVVKFTENSKKLGLVNKLFSMATGKYVAVQDADDTSLQGRILKQVEFLELNPEFDACGTQVAKSTKEGKILFNSSLPLDYLQILESAKALKDIAIPATFLMKKSAVQNLGGYRNEFAGICGEDEDLILRLAARPICNLPDVLYIYRQIPSSLSLKKDSDLKRYAAFKFSRELYFQRLKSEKDWIEKQDQKAIDHFFKMNIPSSELITSAQVMTLLLVGENKLAGQLANQMPFGISKIKYYFWKFFIMISPIHPIEIKNKLRKCFK